MNIITISREFGSGGRELGKRMADILGYAYYDREIEEAIAKRLDMDQGYISRAIEQGGADKYSPPLRQDPGKPLYAEAADRYPGGKAADP